LRARASGRPGPSFLEGLLCYDRRVKPVERVRVRTREGAAETERSDTLAVEEPLEIRVRPAPDGKARSFVVTMRTPGHDEELAAGLLFAEGVVRSRADLVALERPTDPRIEPALKANVIVASLTAEAFGRSESLQRATVMGSSCGVCGKTSIQSVMPADRPAMTDAVSVSAEFLYGLPARLRREQSVFAETGGLHGAALFSDSGELRALREDIGRHNAVDKLVGVFLLKGELPLEGCVLMVSGRAGFEIVQKAFGAGIPILAAVSAPSSLAAELAERTGLTLIGFLRERRFNVYTHARRLRPACAGSGGGTPPGHPSQRKA
jgi:FdhD protein